MKVRGRAAGEPGWRWVREGRQLKAGGQQEAQASGALSKSGEGDGL